MKNQNQTDRDEITKKVVKAYRSLGTLEESLEHNDDHFQKIVGQVLDDFDHVLKQLRERRIEGSVIDVFRFLSELFIPSADAGIIAVHVIRTQEDVDAWNHFTVKTYYQAIVEAVERDVPVKRIFILYRNEITGLAQGYLTNAVRELLLKQKADGIQVLVIVEDRIDNRSSIQNWIVIDDKVVEHSSSASDFAGPYWVNRTTNLSTDQYWISRYTKEFVNLERSAKELDDWLRELDLRRTTTELQISPYVQ